MGHLVLDWVHAGVRLQQCSKLCDCNTRVTWGCKGTRDAYLATYTAILFDVAVKFVPEPSGFAVVASARAFSKVPS